MGDGFATAGLHMALKADQLAPQRGIVKQADAPLQQHRQSVKVIFRGGFLASLEGYPVAPPFIGMEAAGKLITLDFA